MNDVAAVVAIGAAFVWLGLVLGLSFLETPLKFRAPGITLALGLGIGRLVFRALNLAEMALATLLVLSCLVLRPSSTAWVLLVAGALVLGLQVAVLRPPLDRRTQAVMAGQSPGPSRLHLTYIAAEVAKVALLVSLGAVLSMGGMR